MLNHDSSRLSNFFSFQIETLCKLKEFKSNNNQNLLDYIVLLTTTKYSHLLCWMDKLKYLKAASEISWEQIDANLIELQHETEEVLKESAAFKLGTKNPFSAVQRKISSFKKEVQECGENKTKVFVAWSVLAENYGMDPKSSTPETFFKIFSDFLEDFKSRSLQVKEDEKLRKKARKKEIEEKRKAVADKKLDLDRRKADIINRDILPTSSSNLHKRRLTSLATIPRTELKKEKEAEAVLQDVIGNLVTGSRRCLRKADSLTKN